MIDLSNFKLTFNRRLLLRVLNFLLFYVGWGFCLTGAITGNPFLGPIVVAGFLFYHLIQERFRMSEIVMILSLSILGTLNDTIYLNLGMIDYKAGYETIPWLAPLWVTSIWTLFAMSVNHSMVWLRINLVLASVFGAGGGAISYFAAARVGAAVFHPSIIVVLGVIAVVWAIIMPLIILYGQWLEEYNKRDYD